MGVNNRTADRQSHPHAFRLGGEERLEQALRPREVEPRARISDRDKHLAGFVIPGSDFHPPLPVRALRHGLDAIHDQIQHDLLKLD